MKIKQLNEGIQDIISKALSHYDKLQDDEFSGVLELIQEASQKNKDDSTYKLNNELSVSYMGVSYLGYLSFTTEEAQLIKSNWGNIDNESMFISNLLTQITNYALSVIRLVEEGLDLQAKTLLRSLYEEINILIIISYREDVMNEYCNGIDSKTANDVWYNNLRPKKLKKLIAKIEYDLGFKYDHELAELMKENRESTYKFLSNVTHGAFYTNFLGSYAYTDEDEFMPITLFGHYSQASLNTLDTLNWLLFYLTLIINAIFRDVHGISNERLQQENVTFYTCEAYKQVFMNCYLYNLYMQENNH